MQHQAAASSVITVEGDSNNITYSGLEEALADANTQLRYWQTRSEGRKKNGVCLARAATTEEARTKANKASAAIKYTFN